VHKLVWYEVHDSVEAAIRRKKQIKEWKRDWKINLIERDNRHWLDLYAGLGPG
jgi:putative endonuclease